MHSIGHDNRCHWLFVGFSILVDVRAILEHIREPATPPRIASARRPPQWYEDSGEETIDAFDHPQGDPLAQPEPEYAYDQRVSG